MRLLYPFAKRYIAGEDLPTALKSLDRLRRKGYLSTVDILGENTLEQKQAEQARDEYLELLKQIEGIPHPLDLSVKVTQMGMDIDETLCRANIAQILNAAGHHTVRFDIEGSAYTQRTIDMCIDLHREHKNLGQAVQAYLIRTPKDVDRLMDQGISVRICKGAYKEPPEVALQSMDRIREAFLEMAYKLLKDGFLPAIATHDEKLIQNILGFIEREKVDKRSFYFEMLYGVGRDLQRHLLDREFQVRIYVPFGKSWLPYTLRRLAERKENVWFVLKNLIHETFGLRKLH